ncbi:BrnT family toxin [Methylocaldum sp. BRCS4]|nr:BrnT family toxin [Methylocaldum sp. BRCS4]
MPTYRLGKGLCRKGSSGAPRDAVCDWEGIADLRSSRANTNPYTGIKNALVVVHTPRGDRTRLISARKASPKECEAYA